MAARVSAASHALSPELQHESTFRVMVDSVRDYAIFLLAPKGVVASWNPGAQRLQQYTAEEIIGGHFFVFYPQKEIANRKPDNELEIVAQVERFEDEGGAFVVDSVQDDSIFSLDANGYVTSVDSPAEIGHLSRAGRHADIFATVSAPINMG